MLQSRIHLLSRRTSSLFRLSLSSHPQCPNHSRVIRSISSSTPRHATEPSKSDTQAVAAAVSDMVSKRPELILAGKSMREALIKIAADLEPGKGLPEFEKYLAMPEFRDAAFKLMEELEKAGVDTENDEIGPMVAELVGNRAKKSEV